ncbi:hypothetical protein GCM10008967_30790 [Bacillus carboniphilus]|uniref:Uncharacterized protein n=1 Tax=Bacillus carboniphilus TaxID=86663 RepID=A0ABP3G7L8_9BACI
MVLYLESILKDSIVTEKVKQGYIRLLDSGNHHDYYHYLMSALKGISEKKLYEQNKYYEDLMKGNEYDWE